MTGICCPKGEHRVPGAAQARFQHAGTEARFPRWIQEKGDPAARYGNRPLRRERRTIHFSRRNAILSAWIASGECAAPV